MAFHQMWALRSGARGCRAAQGISGAEAAALPAVLRGLNVDVTSMNKLGCASLVAVSAAALSDTAQSAPQVFVLASHASGLAPIRKRLADVSKETAVTTFDSLNGHVCIGTATEALQSGGVKGAKFVVVADADELSSGQGDTLDRIAHLIDSAGAKRPQVLMVGTERASKRHPKFKALQAKIVGSGGHAEITDGKDLFDFMFQAKLGVSATVLSSLGERTIRTWKCRLSSGAWAGERERPRGAHALSCFASVGGTLIYLAPGPD